MGPKATASSGMTDDTIAIRQQIAQTRAEMTATIEQLETRLDPEVLKEQAKTAAYDATIGKAKTMVSRTSNGIVDTIKANPVPLALTALGIGWFIVNARAPQAQQRVVNAIGDKTDDLAHQATDLAQTAQAKVRDVAETAQHKVRDVAHEAKMREQQIQSMAVQRYNDSPLAIGLGVAAVGLLIGLAIPTTQKENQILGATRDKLAHKALGKADELAHQAIDKTKEQLGNDQQQEPAQAQGVQPTLPH